MAGNRLGFKAEFREYAHALFAESQLDHFRSDCLLQRAENGSSPNRPTCSSRDRTSAISGRFDINNSIQQKGMVTANGQAEPIDQSESTSAKE